MATMHFLNGRLVHEDELLISPRDLGYSRGYAAFEFMMTTNGYPFMMKEHIDRLYSSAKSISLTIPWSKETVTDWVLRTLVASANADNESVISILISGGASQSLTPPKTPTIVIMVDARMGGSPQDYANGVNVSLVEFERYKPYAKTTNYAEAVRQLGISGPDVHEIIYYSGDQVREGARCNIFALIDGTLVTPKTDVLLGITRKTILEKLKLSVKAEAKDFTIKELLSASEVFITATGKHIMPVTLIDRKPLGGGGIGDITKETMAKFQNYFKTYRP